MANVGYARVSTVEQHEDRQLEALRPYKIDKWFTEKMTAKTQTENHNKPGCMVIVPQPEPKGKRYIMKAYEEAAVRCAQKRLRLFGKEKAVAHINEWADSWAKRGVTVDKAAVMQATFSGVTRITKEQWNAIPDDYKGRWKKGNWNVPEEWIGKRTVLEGCLPGGHGTALVTEGIHFEIVG